MGARPSTAVEYNGGVLTGSIVHIAAIRRPEFPVGDVRCSLRLQPGSSACGDVLAEAARMDGSRQADEHACGLSDDMRQSRRFWQKALPHPKTRTYLRMSS